MMQRLHPDQLQPGDKVRHYRVVRRLGSGGFSTVFLVEHEGRPYAMKLAARPPSTGGEDEDTTDERAFREAVTLGHFRHPNLPRVHETGRWPDVDSGYFFVVTEYIPGCTFNPWRWKTQPSLRRLVEKVAEATRVLADLHERGVVHRDFKADNLLIREGDERLFLTDFGAAYLPGAYPLTEVVAPTTLHNMPPECASFLINGDWEHGVRLPADPVMDLYCIGALLYEALTDCHPFSPKLPQPELLVAIESVVPKQPMRLDPRVPRALNDLTMRLLAKKPEQRPATARAVHDELMQLMEAEGDSEHWTRPYAFEAREASPAPPPAKEQAQDASLPEKQPEGARWRARARKYGVALLVLALIGGGLGVGWKAVQEKGLHPVSSSHPSHDTSLPSAPSGLTGRLYSLLCAWAAASQLLACASAPVRPDLGPRLEQCPPEARATARQLNLQRIMEVELVTSTCASSKRPCPNAINVKTGPMEGLLILNDKEALLVKGEAKVFPDRAYIFFDRVYPAILSPSNWDSPKPEASPLPLCGAVLDLDLDSFGETTVAGLTRIEDRGIEMDPASVDRSPDAAVLAFPVVFTYIQGPEGSFQPRR